MSEQLKNIETFFNWAIRLAVALILWLVSENVRSTQATHDKIQVLSTKVEVIDTKLKRVELDINDIKLDLKENGK